MHFPNGLEMALLQPLFIRLQDRPDLLQTLQIQTGLRRVSAQGRELMTAQALMTLLETLHAVGEPHIGAWLGTQTDLSAGGGVAYYLRSFATLEGSLQEIMRLRGRLVPDGELRVQRLGEQLRISIRPRYQVHRLGRQLRLEGMLAWLMRVLNHCAVNPLQPSSVELMTTSEGERASLLTIFGVEPSFGGAECAVCYPAETFAQPLPGSNPSLLQALRTSLDYMLPPVRHQVSTARQLREWLRALSDVSEATQMNAARAFHCGASSLRRRLACEGTSFSALLQSDRRQRALRGVALGCEGIDVIAAQLGYTDRSTLERAFLGWFGVRPVQLRNELIAAWPERLQRHAVLLSIDPHLSPEDAPAWLEAACRVKPAPCNGLQGPMLAALLMSLAGMPAASILFMRAAAGKTPVTPARQKPACQVVIVSAA